jgi:hypothetical protein
MNVLYRASGKCLSPCNKGERDCLLLRGIFKEGRVGMEVLIFCPFSTEFVRMLN